MMASLLTPSPSNLLIKRIDILSQTSVQGPRPFPELFKNSLKWLNRIEILEGNFGSLSPYFNVGIGLRGSGANNANNAFTRTSLELIDPPSSDNSPSHSDNALICPRKTYEHLNVQNHVCKMCNNILYKNHENILETLDKIFK